MAAAATRHDRLASRSDSSPVGILRALPALLLLLWAAAAGASEIQERVDRHLAEAAAGGLEPSDYHHLVFAFSWRETLPDWRALDSALDRLSAVRPSDPLLVEEVRLLRARVAVDEGRPAAARELFRGSGGLERWWLSGPVSLAELEDFDGLAVPPAAAAAWRPVGGTDPLGWVRVAGLVWPPQRRLVFLATTVESESEQPVAIRVGASQVARVWVNGEVVLTTGQPMEHAEDQAAGGAWLRRGGNRVVVAVGSESDDWWLRVRLSAPDGGRIGGVAELDTPPLAAAPVGRTPPPVRSLGAELEAAVARGSAGARSARAAYLVTRRPRPADSGEARSACRDARTESPGEARLLESLLTSEPKAQRALLEEAVEADPALVWARLALASWYHRHGLFAEAAERLDPAGDDPAVRAVRHDMDADLWGVLALPRLAEVARDAPRCLHANLLAATTAADADRWPLAREAVARLEQVAPGRSEVLEVADRVRVACGDGEGLRRQLEAVVGREPNLPAARIRLARLRLADGDEEGARSLIRDGLVRSPDDVDLLMEVARLDHAAGEEEAAAVAARRVLEVRPQDRRAERLLRRLGEPEPATPWRRGTDELRRLAEAAPADPPAVVLLEHKEVRVLPGQLTEERVQLAWLVRRAEQAGSLRELPIAYVPERQRLRVLAARVVRSGGLEAAAQQSDTPRLSEPELNLYYDTRLRRLRFPELEDGDLIEVCYVLSETSEANETGPYRGGFVTVGGELPTVLAEVELAAQPEHLPAWETWRLDAAGQREVADDGTVHLRWTLHDMPALPRDVPPAPRLLAQPYLLYSNHPSWGDLADWYRRHVAPRVRASRQIEELARRLSDRFDDRAAKIDVLYRYVTNDIRYVGLELGEHRFRPFAADWVVNHGIGDCKDKAGLLVTLLEVIGVPAHMVLIRTADLGPVPTSIAALELFNHAIVYLPEDDLWLDGTASGHDGRLPPGLDQGAWALVVTGLDSRPEVTPVVGAGVARSEFVLRRRDAGTVEVEVEVRDTGDAASSRRGAFAGSSDPKRFARWLQSMFPSADLVAEPVVRIRPSKDPVSIRLAAQVPRSALLAGGGVPVYPGQLELVTRLAPGGTRTGPLMVTAEPRLEWTVTVELDRPPQTVPEPVDLETPSGSLRLDVRTSPTGIEVSGSFELVPGLVPVERAGELRDFLIAVERALSRPLEVP